jgi:uroporphyrin-3 C-methyltransferase
MNTESHSSAPSSSTEVIENLPVVPVSAQRPAGARRLAWVLGMVSVLSLLVSALLWQQLTQIQQQQERQSADSGNTAIEARALARQAQEQVRDSLARQTLMEARLSEVALQRSQLQELMQSLSRSRDENLVADIESAIRLAQQQTQLTGSVEPLLAALKSAEVRVARAGQPRLAPLQQAIARDLGRVKSAVVSDTPTLLVKLDELVLLADDLPLSNALASARVNPMSKPTREDTAIAWWQRWLQSIQTEARTLVRVSRIDQPEAALLSPEQSFFLRENFKLRLLNARLGLLARQMEASRADLASASSMIGKYFDPVSRKTQHAATLLLQMQGQLKNLEVPRVDDTLAALTTAAAGK